MRRGAWEFENLGRIIIALVLLIILIFLIITLKGKGIDLIDKIKDILYYR